MASGLLGFLGFGKKDKPNLAPSSIPPSLDNLDQTTNLRDLVKRRMVNGQDLGYGDDFVSKTTNPAIAKIDSDFQNKTLPRISSEASKRGIARSSITTDQIGKAEADKNLNTDNMVAEFYKLNEMQKKADFGQALGVSENLQNQDASLQTARADAAANQVGRNVTAANLNNANDLKRQNQVIGSLANSIAPGSGSAFGAPAATKTATDVATKQNILGDDDYSQLEAYLKSKGLI